MGSRTHAADTGLDSSYAQFLANLSCEAQTSSDVCSMPLNEVRYLIHISSENEYSSQRDQLRIPTDHTRVGVTCATGSTMFPQTGRYCFASRDLNDQVILHASHALSSRTTHHFVKVFSSSTSQDLAPETHDGFPLIF